MTPKEKRIRYFFAPALFQFVLLFLIIALFVLFIGRGNGAPLLLLPFPAYGEMTDPNLARLVYMTAAFLAAPFLCLCSFRLLRREAQNISASFWLSNAGGIMLWQSVGECAWHFGIPSATDGIIAFPRLESAAGFPLFFLFISLYAVLRYTQKPDFSVKVFLLSFLLNWTGHIAMIGTYPFASAFVSMETWYRIAGAVSGLPLIICALWGLFRKDSPTENLYIRSLLFCSGLAFIAMGFRPAG